MEGTTATSWCFWAFIRFSLGNWRTSAIPSHLQCSAMMAEWEKGFIVFALDPGNWEVCGDEDGPKSAHRWGAACRSPVTWLCRGREAAQEEECAQGVSNAGLQSCLVLGVRWCPWLPQHHAVCRHKRGLWQPLLWAAFPPPRKKGGRLGGPVLWATLYHRTDADLQWCIWDKLACQFLKRNGFKQSLNVFLNPN